MANNPSDQAEEPVAYLGGQGGPPPEDAPIEGYLGGDAPPDSLPALPPAEPQYSATDFIEPPAEAPPESYADYAEAPVEAPTGDATQFEQYGHDEQATAAEDYAADGTQTVPEAPPPEQSSDFDEPGLPKTISQQDAENIIKRITTKKILPPEVAAAEGPRINPPAEFTPRGGAKLGRIIFVLLILLGGAGAAVYFKEDLRPYAKQYLPDEAYEAIYGKDKEVEIKPDKPTETDVQKAERLLRERVGDAERRFFGYPTKEDFDKAQKEGGEGEKKPGDPSTTTNGAPPK